MQKNRAYIEVEQTQGIVCPLLGGRVDCSKVLHLFQITKFDRVLHTVRGPFITKRIIHVSTADFIWVTPVGSNWTKKLNTDISNVYIKLSTR